MNAPVLEAVTGAIYKADGSTVAPGPLFTGGVQYIVAGASTGAGWNGAEDLVVQIEFRINSLPDTLHYRSDPFLPVSLTFTDLSAGGASWGNIDGTVAFHRTAFMDPPRPYIFIDPASKAAAIGQIFTVDVKINASAFWDIDAYDVTVEYNSTIITLLNATEGGFLKQGGASTFLLNFTTSNSIEMVCTKLSNPVASSGVDTLFTLQFNVTCQYSHQPISCNLELNNTVIELWPHPEISIGPWWNDVVMEIELVYDGKTVPPALPYTHYTVGGTFSVNLGDVNNDGTINLKDLVSFANAYDSNVTSPNWNERADLAPPFGQISLTDLVTFAVYCSHP